MARVIISAGHTQNEPGAVVDDLREVDLTRKIAGKVVTKLRSEGVISLSVPPELDLLARVDWINRTGYKEGTEDICIELHVNDGGKSGLEGWHKDKGENKSQELTEKIIKEACKKTGLTNQGVKSEYDHPLQILTFLHNTNPTSALIECLYIDNPNDQNFLKDDSKLELLADGIAGGILKFFGIEGTDKKPVPFGRQQPVSSSPMATFPRTSAYPQQTGPAGGRFPSSSPMQSPAPYSQPSIYGGSNFSGGPGGTPSRDERKQMIQNKYRQVLGRKASEQDQNYFLNLGLTEDQMTRRIVDSQEHVDIVRNSQEYKKIKPKHESLEVESKELKAQVSDKEGIIKKQNDLIVQKNKIIQEFQQSSGVPLSFQKELEQSVVEEEAVVKEDQEAEIPSSVASIGYQKERPEKETFIDRVLKKLNDIFD